MTDLPYDLDTGPAALLPVATLRRLARALDNAGAILTSADDSGDERVAAIADLGLTGQTARAKARQIMLLVKSLDSDTGMSARREWLTQHRAAVRDAYVALGHIIAALGSAGSGVRIARAALRGTWADLHDPLAGPVPSLETTP